MLDEYKEKRLIENDIFNSSVKSQNIFLIKI